MGAHRGDRRRQRQWRVTAYDTANNLIADSSWLHPFSVTDTPIASVAVSITGSGVVDSTLTLNRRSGTCRSAS